MNEEDRFEEELELKIAEIQRRLFEMQSPICPQDMYDADTYINIQLGLDEAMYRIRSRISTGVSLGFYGI